MNFWATSISNKASFPISMVYYRGPEDHINTRILHSSSQTPNKGIPEILRCRSLVFMWSFGPLYFWNAAEHIHQSADR